MVFEACKSATPPLVYEANCIEQVDEFKHLSVLQHATRGLSPAIEYMRNAAKHAMFNVQCRCQQLHIHDLVLKCKVIHVLVKHIWRYCC